jgi:hypothetical protein
VLDRYPPFDWSSDPTIRPRVLVIGLGKMGRSLVVQTAREWWIRHGTSDGVLRVTAVDRAATRKKEKLLLQYPQLGEVCEIEALDMEKNSPDFADGGYLLGADGQCDVGVIYVTFGDEPGALSAALALRELTQRTGCSVPIVLRMAESAGLASLAGADDTGISGIHPFCILDETCSRTVLLEGAVESVARALYSASKSEPVPTPTEWHSTPESQRLLYRRGAVALREALESTGRVVVPLGDWAQTPARLTPEEIRGVLDAMGTADGFEPDADALERLYPALARVGYQIRTGDIDAAAPVELGRS